MHVEHDILMCSTCLLCVNSVHMRHIRLSLRANTTNLFPAQKPNICSCSDAGLNEGTGQSCSHVHH